MKSSKHIFLSFKTEERDNAFLLKNALAREGYVIWWQEELQCGQEWHGEIDKAIDEAGAIIVMWSEKSINSPWVTHEASQAMARNRYAPIRINVMNITSPYDRIQATDLIDWNGDKQHHGFQNLLKRLEELMPGPMPWWRKTSLFFWNQRAAIFLLMITLFAFKLFFDQGNVLDQQIENQQQLKKSMDSTYNSLELTKDSIRLQFHNIAEGTQLMSKRFESGLIALDSQLNNTNANQTKLSAMTNTISDASKETIRNLQAAIYSLETLNSNQMSAFERLQIEFDTLGSISAKLSSDIINSQEILADLKGIALPIFPLILECHITVDLKYPLYDNKDFNKNIVSQNWSSMNDQERNIIGFFNFPMKGDNHLMEVLLIDISSKLSIRSESKNGQAIFTLQNLSSSMKSNHYAYRIIQLTSPTSIKIEYNLVLDKGIAVKNNTNNSILSVIDGALFFDFNFEQTNSETIEFKFRKKKWSARFEIDQVNFAHKWIGVGYGEKDIHSYREEYLTAHDYELLSLTTIPYPIDQYLNESDSAKTKLRAILKIDEKILPTR